MADQNQPPSTAIKAYLQSSASGNLLSNCEFYKNLLSLQRSLASIEASVGRRFMDDEFRQSKERERSVCLTENERTGNALFDRVRVLESVELREKEVVARELKVEERFKELELKEKEVNEEFVSLRNEIELKCKEMVENRGLLELREKNLEENFAKLKREEMEIIERRKGVELMKEKVELLKKEFSEGLLALESRESRINERDKKVRIAEKDVERRLLDVKLEEEEFKEGVRVFEFMEKKLSEKEKDMDECYEALSLREKEVDEEFRALKSKRKEINKSRKEVDLREKEVDEEFRALESKRKEFDESREEVDLMMKEVDQSWLEVEKKDEEVNGKLRELKLMEMKVDERFRAVELRESELSERFLGLDLKEKEISEMHKGAKLLENEVSERFRGLGLKENQLNERCKRLESKEKELDEYQKVVVLGKKQLNDTFKACVLKVKQMEDRCAVIGRNYHESAKVIEKHLDEDLAVLGTKMKEIEELGRAMELKEKLIIERNQAMEVKEKELDAHYSSLESKEEEIRERSGVVVSKEKQLKEIYEAVELKEKLANEKFSELELKTKEFDKRFNAMEEKEKNYMEQCKYLESKEEEISERSKAVELKEKQLQEKMVEILRVMKLKKKEIDDHLDAVEVKEKQIKRRSKVLDWKHQWISERYDTQLCKEKELIEQRQALEMKEKLVDERSQSLEVKEKHFSERCTAFELKEKQLDEHFWSLKSKANHIVECSKAIKLKEKQLEEELKAIEFKKRQIDEEYRVLELNKMKSNDNYEAELNEKQTRSNRALDSCEELIDECSQDLDLEEGEIDQRAVVPGLSARGEVSVTAKGSSTEAEVGVIELYPESSLIDNLQKLCGNMDTKGVSCFLIEHVEEYDVLDDKVLDSLRSASDPAKLVLNVIQSFYELELEKVPLEDFIASCIFLLVQLVKLRADISSYVEGEAKKFVDVWRFLLKQDRPALENFGFFLFLASFNMVDNYEADEILSLFETFFDDIEAYKHAKVPSLCHELGLTTKIPDLIQSLITGDKLLLAVRHICALEMEDAFPLASILDAHLENIRKRVKEIVEQGSGTAQDDAVTMESNALKEVMKCISECELESSYSPIALKSRIEQLELKLSEISSLQDKNKQLEKELKEGKTDPHPPEIKRCSSMKREGAKEITETSNPQALPSDAESSKKRHANSRELLHEKRQRVVGDYREQTLSNSSPSYELPSSPYQYHPLPHLNSPAVDLPGYHLVSSRSMYT